LQESVNLTENKAPSQLAELKNKQVRFNLTAAKDDMAKVVFDMLGI